jgi:hypothetical protein
MRTIEQDLFTDVDEITPTIDKLVNRYAVELDDVPGESTYVGDIASNPLLPDFAKFAVLQSLGYPVSIAKVHESEGENEERYINPAFAIYIPEGDEARRIMISPEAWPANNQPPFAGLMSRLWGYGEGYRSQVHSRRAIFL